MKLKEFYKSNRSKILVSSVLVLAFLFGYSLPSLRTNQGLATNNNIGIKPLEQQNVKAQNTEEPIPSSTAASKQKKQNPNTKMDASCPIKGKTSAKGTKTYYIPGSAYYAKTKADKCFVSESEAKTAGYTKSKR